MNKNLLILRNFPVILIALLSMSCNEYKQIPYFQDVKSGQISTDKISNYSLLTIHSADILGVSVSSRNPESSSIFNYNLARANGDSFNTKPDNPVTGYRVDENGMIHLPLIGEMKVAGMTTNEVTEKLSAMLLTYFKDPIVNIRVLNFKVAVYGDVLRPDVYTLQNEAATVTQALSLAGDLNITALRKNVLLIRVENGERKYVHLDLTTKEFMQSPYYYLKNNDEIYVTPGRSKFANVNSRYRDIGLIISALSIAILLYRYH